CTFHCTDMATPKNTTGKRSPKGAVSGERNGAERPAAYFLSLTVENVRCFGPKQTLDLSDGNAKPAAWTIILGLNGTGKTTVLQALAGFDRLRRPVIGTGPNKGPTPRLFDPALTSVFNFRRTLSDQVASLSIRFSVSNSISGAVLTTESSCFEVNRGSSLFGWIGGIAPPWCCGFGASRRMGATSLPESGADDATATLFSDKSDLRNPEEWLFWLDLDSLKNGDYIRRRRD